MQHAGLQAESAKHARLFVLGNQGFQRPMLQVCGFQHCHDDSHAQPVVGTEGSALGFQPIAVHVSLDGVFGEVVHGVIVLLRHHVHVRLQDDTLAVLHARSSRFADNDIACLVHKRLQTQAFAVIHQIFCDLLHVSRRTRDTCKLVKMLPHILWSQF